MVWCVIIKGHHHKLLMHCPTVTCQTDGLAEAGSGKMVTAKMPVQKPMGDYIHHYLWSMLVTESWIEKTTALLISVFSSKICWHDVMRYGNLIRLRMQSANLLWSRWQHLEVRPQIYSYWVVLHVLYHWHCRDFTTWREIFHTIFSCCILIFTIWDKQARCIQRDDLWLIIHNTNQ